MDIIYSCRLENVTATHNKFYILEIIYNDTSKLYQLRSHHGKIGTEGIKKLVFFDAKLSSVQTECITLKNKKINQRGYKFILEYKNNNTTEVLTDKILTLAKNSKAILILKKKQFSIFSPGRLSQLI